MQGTSADAQAHAAAEAGKGVRSPALFVAAEFGELEAVRSLVAAGADPAARDERGDSVLQAAARAGEVDVVEWLAPRFGRREARRARRLARRVASDISSDSRREHFLRAVSLGKRGAVKRMLRAGLSSDAALSDGTTALMLAVRSGYLGVLKELLDGGADVHRRVDYETAIFGVLEALRTDPRIRREVVRLLMRAGAELEARDGDGLTPLMRAVMDGPGDPGAIRALVENGADPNAKHEAGVSVLEIARQDPNKAELAELLVELGASSPAENDERSHREPLRGLGGIAGGEVVLLLRAPAADVADALASHRRTAASRALVLESDGDTDLGEGFLVYQQLGDDWTLVQTPFLDHRALRGSDAAVLSRALGCRAIFIEAGAPEGRIRLRRHDRGRLRDRRRLSRAKLDTLLRRVKTYLPGVPDEDLSLLRERLPSDRLAALRWLAAEPEPEPRGGGGVDPPAVDRASPRRDEGSA